MSKLGNLKPQGFGARDNFGTENVVFQVTGYHVEDPKRPSDGDYIEGLLCHDINKLKAEFDADGNPTTKIKVRYAKPLDDKNSRRPSVLEYQRGRGNSKPMDPANGALGMATRAYIDPKTGDLAVAWLERWYPEVKDQNHFPLLNVLASVRAEYEIKRDNEPVRYGQNRFVIDTSAAVLFKGLDDFKAKAAKMIDDMSGNPGVHGVIVRIIDKTDFSAASIEFFEGWDAENNTARGGAAAVEYFLTNEKNAAQTAEWVSHITSEDPDLVFELIPQMRIMTGSMSLPSSLVSDKKREGKEVSESDMLRFDDSLRYRVAIDEEGRTQPGYAMSHVQVMRVGNDPNAPWFSGGTVPVQASPVLYLREEIITPNVPPAAAAKFTADAEARREARRSTRAPAAEAEQAASNAPTM